MEHTELVDRPDYPLALTDATFDQALAKYPLIVVDFWAPWCMPCRMLGPIIESLAKKLSPQAVFGKINVDEAVVAAGKYGIMSIPTLLVFKQGVKVDEMVGALPEKALEERVLSHAK